MNYRNRIGKAISRRSESTRELIDCDMDFYIRYIESKFKNGMSWSNYGEWHIDHIKPCASFDLNDKKQLRSCFNYKNTQPLWAYENRAKGCKLQANNKYGKN